jgi:urate oxidase
VSGFDWIEGGLWQAEQYEWERILWTAAARPLVRAQGQGTASGAVQVVDGRDARHRRREGPDGAQIDRQRVRRVPARRVHDPRRDRRSHHGDLGHRALAVPPEAVEAGIDYNGLYAEVSAVLLSTFATVHSLALQQTLFAMGKAAIEARPEDRGGALRDAEQAPLPL